MIGNIFRIEPKYKAKILNNKQIAKFKNILGMVKKLKRNHAGCIAGVQIKQDYLFLETTLLFFIVSLYSRVITYGFC